MFGLVVIKRIVLADGVETQHALHGYIVLTQIYAINSLAIDSAAQIRNNGINISNLYPINLNYRYDLCCILIKRIIYEKYKIK